MTQTISSTETANTDPFRSLRWGAPAAVAVAAIGVYVDRTLTSAQQANQEAVLPWVIAVAVIVGGLLFGLAVSRALRSRNMVGWALDLGLVGVALAAYWGGLPVVFGAAIIGSSTH
jgi:hypothetical protein